jgi:hypothetical protein
MSSRVCFPISIGNAAKGVSDSNRISAASLIAAEIAATAEIVVVGVPV